MLKSGKRHCEEKNWHRNWHRTAWDDARPHGITRSVGGKEIAESRAPRD
jgi:hypothetical protein